VEIPDLTSLPEIHGEPVFHGYRKAGYLSCQMAGQIRENGQKTVLKSVTKEHEKRVIRPSLKCRSGGGNVNRRYPDGYLLQFALPCGNGRKVEDF